MSLPASARHGSRFADCATAAGAVGATDRPDGTTARWFYGASCVGGIRQLGEDPTFARHIAAPDVRTADSAMTLMRSVQGTSVISVELRNADGRPVLSTAAAGVPAASPAEASDLLQRVASSDTVAAIGPLIILDSTLTSRDQQDRLPARLSVAFLVEWGTHSRAVTGRDRQSSELAFDYAFC